jgi:hypothetical protein
MRGRAARKHLHRVTERALRDALAAAAFVRRRAFRG